jgi:hypothetical protein
MKRDIELDRQTERKADIETLRALVRQTERKEIF